MDVLNTTAVTMMLVDGLGSAAADSTGSGTAPAWTPQQVPLVRFLSNPGGYFGHLADAVAGFSVTWWPVEVPLLVAAACAAAGARLRLRARHRRLMRDGARFIDVQVPPTVEPGAGEAFWANLHALLRPTWRRFLDGQPHLVFEYTWTRDTLALGIWVPGVVPLGVVEAAVEGAWPGARTTVLSPPPHPLPPIATASTGGRLRLARPEYLPLRHRHEADPLRPLLAAASNLVGQESAAIQVLARPATGRRVRKHRRALARFRHQATGASTSVPLKTVVFDEFSPGKPMPRATGRQDPVQAASLRAAVSKTGGPLWETEIRYAVATTAQLPTDRTGRKAVQGRLRGLAHGLASALGVHAERNWWARKPLRNAVAAMTSRFLNGGDLITLAELAAAAHLPLDAGAIGVVRAGARSVAPPPSTPGVGSTCPVKLLGDADAGPARPVAINVSDSRQHTHILGATGCGKSTLMGRMILDDVEAGRGVVVIDPKGDLIADILQRLPASAADRTTLIDPTDTGPRPSLNILAAGDPELLVDNLVGIFRRIFSAFWGPRTDDILRSACLTLLATMQAGEQTPTLSLVPKLLTDRVYRKRVVDELPPNKQADTYRTLREFWAWYDGLSATAQGTVTGPLLNKLRAFLLRDFVADIVTRPDSTIDLAEVLDGGILLVRLPKGVLGEEAVRLLGSFIVAATWQGASNRAKSGEGARTDAALYVDECHNFLNLPYPLEDMLAEARAYRLSLVLAHQNLAQLGTELREGVSANTRNKVFFTCSPEDARSLSVHTAPNLSEHDLSHLGAYQAAVRLAVNGVQAPAFTMRTRSLPAAPEGRADLIRAGAHAITAERSTTASAAAVSTHRAVVVPAPTHKTDRREKGSRR